MSIFLNSLIEEARFELKLHSVGSLDELMELFELIDNQNRLLLKGDNPTVLGIKGFSRDTSFDK